MRTYQDAKVIAKSLRDSLAVRNVSLSHSECLEIVAQQFGFTDWNTLAAKLTTPTVAPEQLSCSFCGKSQHDVRSLVEGGCVRARRAPRGRVAFSSAMNASRSARRSILKRLATPKKATTSEAPPVAAHATSGTWNCARNGVTVRRATIENSKVSRVLLQTPQGDCPKHPVGGFQILAIQAIDQLLDELTDRLADRAEALPAGFGKLESGAALVRAVFPPVDQAEPHQLTSRAAHFGPVHRSAVS
jgi:hypothetical protein